MSKVTHDTLELARGDSLAKSLFRIALSFIVLFGTYIGLQLAAAAIAHRLPASDREAVMIGGLAALCPAMPAVYVLFVRLSERRWPRELALSPGLVIFGAVLGAVLFCFVYGVLIWLGAARFLGPSANAAPVLPLAIALSAGIGEEITFRGGVFRLIEERFGTAIALAVSAVAFGLVHALNPGATLVSTAAIAIEAGVLLGLAYAATRNLWFPIGLHAGWGFTEGGVFGTAVSGHANRGLFDVALSGPDTLTGGSFGPEASLIAVSISLAASAALFVVVLRNGRWKPRRAMVASATTNTG